MGGLTWDGGAVVASVALVGAWIRFSMRAMIREEIRKENDIQIAKINGTYKRTAEYAVRDAEIERRLEVLEARRGA